MPFVEAVVIKFYPSPGRRSLQWMFFVEADHILWACDDTTIHLGWPHKSWDLQRPVVSGMAKGLHLNLFHLLHLLHHLHLIHLLLPLFMGEADACGGAPDPGNSWRLRRTESEMHAAFKYTSYLSLASEAVFDWEEFFTMSTKRNSCTKCVIYTQCVILYAPKMFFFSHSV